MDHCDQWSLVQAAERLTCFSRLLVRRGMGWEVEASVKPSGLSASSEAVTLRCVGGELP